MQIDPGRMMIMFSGAVKVVVFVFLYALAVAVHASSSTSYFAYGSNMLASRLSEERNVQGLEKIGVATLKGYSLNYSKRGNDGTGKCNIQRADGGVVYGVIFKVPNSEMKKIDRAEGASVSPHYSRKSITISIEGRRIEAVTYMAQPQFVVQSGYLKPSQEYTDKVNSGARESDLPIDYLEHLEQAAKGFVQPFKIRKNSAARHGVSDGSQSAAASTTSIQAGFITLLIIALFTLLYI
jgi:cation transport regulator ChaC